jgi:hypothetical protein
MDIEFRNAGGSRVGFITGNDIKDWNGNRVGMIVGNDIKDSYGNRVGALYGSDIKDSNGNRVGMIIGNDIKDTYGNRVGYPESGASQIEMAAAGLILFRLKPEATSAANPVKTPSSSDSEKNSTQYENSAVNSGSIVDSLSQTLGQTLFANMSLETAKKWAKTFYEAQDEERERKWKEKEEAEAKEKAEKEAWKKKRIIVYGIVGLISGLSFTFLPGFAADNEVIAMIIRIVISLASAFLIFMSLLDYFGPFLFGIIGGVIIYFISPLLGELFFILPIKVLYFPIGFIFGALITLLIKKIFSK